MAYLDVELRSAPDRALALLALRPVTAGVRRTGGVGAAAPATSPTWTPSDSDSQAEPDQDLSCLSRQGIRQQRRQGSASFPFA